MSELTLHTGSQGERTTIHIDWVNENNVRRDDRLEIIILDRDKPRTLAVLLNDVEIARIVATNWRQL